MLKMKQKMEKMQVLNDGADEEDFKELLQILRSFGEVEVLYDVAKVVKYITVAKKLIKDDKNINKKLLSIRLKIVNKETR